MHGLSEERVGCSPGPKGDPIKKFTLGLVGAAAIFTGLVLLKQKREEPEIEKVAAVPAGETAPRQLSLERMRELGV